MVSIFCAFITQSQISSLNHVPGENLTLYKLPSHFIAYFKKQSSFIYLSWSINNHLRRTRRHSKPTGPAYRLSSNRRGTTALALDGSLYTVGSPVKQVPAYLEQPNILLEPTRASLNHDFWSFSEKDVISYLNIQDIQHVD